MRRLQLIAAAAAGAMIFSACAKKDEATEGQAAEAAATPAVDLAAEEQAIRNRSGEWMNYANAKDAASIANGIFTPDGTAIMNDKAHKGSAAIQAGMEKQMKENPDALVSWATEQVRVAQSGDLALETGSFNFDPDGAGKKPEVHGSFVTTWVKVDDQWRAAADAGGENVATATP